MGNRQNNSLITVSVEHKAFGGLFSLGVFEDRSGGESDSTSTRYPRGGLGTNEALGGRPEVTNVIVARLLDEEARGYRKKLRSVAGKATLIVHEQPIDDEGTPEGEPETWTGKLKKVSPSDSKAESSAARILTLEMVPSGPVV